MEIIIICIATFFTAVLTFFSGFGLGTILTPLFVFFFPVDLAIALTGVVHFVNNLFKLFLVGKSADWGILKRFGIPAVIAAFLGAWIMLNMTGLGVLHQYSIGEQVFSITPIKLLIGLILIVFAVIELIPFFEKLNIQKQWLPVGGVLSGLFGGLSGHQGALRSAFLVKMGLSKEVFIGTSVVIACFIDFTRLSVYATRFGNVGLGEHMELVVAASISAICGALLGKKLLKKITIQSLQRFVAILLIIISIALILGLI